MRQRRRQIRRSSPTGNISSSKVESASMSDKSERFGADPSTSGVPGQVAQVSNVQETTHRGSSSSPPLDLSNCPDEFKSLARDRLHPCESKTTSPSALQQYHDYLHWFYYSHRDPAPVASLAEAASMCLEKENSMISLWVSVKGYCNWQGCTVSKFIVGYMNIAINEKGEIEHPFGIEAAKCIAKEAELISEWLRHGRHISNDDEYTLCHDIRVAAAQLFISRLKWSDQVAAALLGIRKEAEWLIEDLKGNFDESISTSLKIREFALCLVQKKLDELQQFESSESDMSFESESNDDVAGSEDNNYRGDWYDEDYSKFYR